jgi:hypothetical protein
LTGTNKADFFFTFSDTTFIQDEERKVFSCFGLKFFDRGIVREELSTFGSFVWLV